MSLTTAYIAIAGFAYLLGSIPFGYVLVRAFLKQDIRATGSGNIGATNVARSGKTGLAIATLFLDALKGYAAVWLVLHIFVPRLSFESELSPERLVMISGLAALCAITGHIFPIWLRFRGGKGVATGAGAFLALAPLQLAITLLIFAFAVALTRYVSLGSIAATISFPILLWVFRPEWRSVVAFLTVVFASLLIIVRHHDNIRRLLSGTESKFGKPKVPPSPTQVEKEA